MATDFGGLVYSAEQVISLLNLDRDRFDAAHFGPPPEPFSPVLQAKPRW